MMTPLKIMMIAGARPNFMKVAPLMRAMDRHNASAVNGTRRIETRLVHTGQHYDEAMSEVFFRELNIRRPDFNLEVGSGSHAAQTAALMLKFEPICLAENPDWVVVVGDVNSTMACALVCAKLGVKVAHVEAGLRSFDRTMPEEINRIVTDSLADLLLTPSEDGDENLRREGIPSGRVVRVGNVMIDAVIANLSEARSSTLTERLGLRAKGFVYVTLHRPSNVDQEPSLRSIIGNLKFLAQTCPVVFPIHPRTRKMCAQFGIALDDTPELRVLDPIGYHDSLGLTESARCIVTDSGGIQEESTFFKTPCLTLRPNTERPITITVGSNRLTTIDRLVPDVVAALANGSNGASVPPLWDGCASERIIAALLEKDEQATDHA